MDKKLVFPKDFWWGSATSGPQSEGDFNKPHKSVFDKWFEVEPEIFFDGVGPQVTSNFYNTYKEDIAMLKEIGLNSFRTSIQWTRLIKDLETGEPDADGVRFYNDVIDECIKNNIIPVMNLHHFDLPVELYEKHGGWESSHVTDLFAKFAGTAFKLFGDRVKTWITFNEPIVVIEGQYLYGFHYPKVVDGKKFVQAMFNINLASAKAIKVYKEQEQDGSIGIVLNLAPPYPRSESKEDKLAAEITDVMFNRCFLDPAVKGEFPTLLTDILKQDEVIWTEEDGDMDIIKENVVDFLGVNYYQPLRVKERETEVEFKTWMPNKYFEGYKMPGRRMNEHRGWEIYPKGVYDIAINIRDNYDNIPWFVSENGMGVEGESKFLNADGIIEDDYRVEFFEEHLTFLHNAIEEGANCFGFHSWTPIDCWSWCNAYKNRYGFISLDLETGKKTIKKSGRWIKEVAKNNGF